MGFYIEKIPTEFNGITMEEADYLADEFLKDTPCNRMWDAMRALRDFYETVTSEAVEFKNTADTPQTDEFKNFDRESLILLIECQKERIGELLADKDIPQTKAVVKPYKPTNREILDAIENSDCPWK